MVKLDADGCVISALDEVAWLFNIRGSDVPYEPMLLSYSLVTLSEIFLFVEPDKITANLTNHLNGDNCTTSDSCVRFVLFFHDFPAILSLYIYVAFLK